jgi:hypothetical protein
VKARYFEDMKMNASLAKQAMVNNIAAIKDAATIEELNHLHSYASGFGACMYVSEIITNAEWIAQNVSIQMAFERQNAKLEG